MEWVVNLLTEAVNNVVFWAAWIIIPIIMEIIPAVQSVITLIKHRFKPRNFTDPTIWPEITLISPVYNSAGSLEACIASIAASDYPSDRIHILLVDNQSTDDSFEVFCRCQEKYPKLIMQWMSAKQGKSRALNLALHNSSGKYIIHIDSDGVLDAHALTNMVRRFEANPKINCMTGAIMVNPELVEAYPFGPKRLLRKIEFMEYAQGFLAGRNAASDSNRIYTLSGAFSAFRNSSILKSWLYSTDTVSEDTQISFQMRYLQRDRIGISEDAIFFVDPIEDIDKLYTQRQRWQRGALEVAKLFSGEKLTPFKLFTDVNINALVYDHTFAFPRMLWYLALLCLLFVGYSGKTVIAAMGVIFLLYIVLGYMYFGAVCFFLRKFPKTLEYYRRQWWVVALLPFFNLIMFFVRMAGIVNSIGTDSAWKTRTLTEERDALEDVVKGDTSKIRGAIHKVSSWVNVDPGQAGAGRSLERIARGSIVGSALLVIACTVATLFVAVVTWASGIFQVSFDALLATVFGPMAGAGSNLVYDAVKTCLPPVLIVLAVSSLLVVFLRRRANKAASIPDVAKRKKNLDRIILTRRAMVTACAGALAYGLYATDKSFGLASYVSSRFSTSSIYEKSYVDPKTVEIVADGKTKNLICIYLESMETTYASTEAGGRQPVNYIPNLTRLANEHVSFSNTDKLGGFHSTSGTTWTMAALLATTSGVPYALPAEAADLAEASMFASGLVTLGDILADEGYTQEFMCGSNAKFGGRQAFFKSHGDYEIYDLFTAREQGKIPNDYKVWWGFEDAKLYEYAKEELTRLASGSQPYNFTMLSVDTHAPDGYLCELCQNEYESKAANVIACADRQVADFVEWILQQPFAEDAVIVIMGDHPRMDAPLVEGYTTYERTVYNCLINAEGADGAVTENREFTHMDMLPTVLSALGFEIEGEKLGLGTNLFSDVPTLAESEGYARLDYELSMNSDWYVNTFAPEMKNGNAG